MKNLEGLIKVIENEIIAYNDNNDIFDKLKEKVKLRINLEKLTKVWNGLFAIGMLNEDEQYYIVSGLYDVIKDTDCNPELYFYENEITDYNTAPVELDKYNTNVWILHNVDRIDEHTFTCHDAITVLSDGVDTNFLTYNTDTQRKPKIEKTKSGNVIKLPDIKLSSARDIAKLFEEGTHPQNQITLNIRYIDGTELKKISYNAKKRTLTFEQDPSLYVDIIDGAHRVQGATMAVHKIKDNIEKQFALNKQLNIQIEHLDVQQALQIVKATAKNNPLDEEFLASINEKDIGLDMVREIMRKQTRNSLFGKIADYEEEVFFNKKYCYVRTLSQAINYHFGDILLKSKDYRESRLINEHIINVINEVFGVYREEISDNISDTRKKNILLMDKTFVGYVAIAKATYNVEEWATILDNVLDNLNIKWNDVWKGNLKLQSKGQLDNRFIKVISDYFEKLITNEIKKEGAM